VGRCNGCIEFCNKNFKCLKKDDLDGLLDKMEKADGYVFACPSYFYMPPGIFKDFMDRTCAFYNAQKDFSKKRAAVICVGADSEKQTEECTRIVVEDYCKTLGIMVVAKHSIRSTSELKGNYNDVFEKNPQLEKQLEDTARLLVKSIQDTK
jgi:multimeric flavodoxin WrbA